MDERPPPQNPPGWIAWGMTAVCLLLPVLALPLGWLGITDQGNTISIGLFGTSFAFLVVSVVLSIVVHLWGMIKAFYPTISKAWLTICLVGILGGCITLVSAVVLMFRLYGLI